MRPSVAGDAIHALGIDAPATPPQQRAHPPVAEARALLPRVQTARAYHGMVQATMALGRFGPCTATYEQFASDFGLPMPTGVLSLAAAGRATLARLLRSLRRMRRPHVLVLGRGYLKTGFKRRVFHSLFATDDQKEGMAAFVEKRKPVFRDT